MQIAICDDEKIFRDSLKNVLIEYKKEKRIHLDIFEYSSGEELLASNNVFDMVFMDYQMSGIDGLEASKVLREKNCLCSIIFITAYPEFILDSFAVQPFRFIIKPLNADKIHEALESYIQQQKLLFPIVVTENGEQKTINSQDIVYLEGDGKYCIIRTNQETLHSSKTLSQVYQLLPQHCFYRTHKSYVVNMYRIDSLNKDAIKLSNGEIAKIGRNHTADFKKTYLKFIKNYFVRF